MKTVDELQAHLDKRLARTEWMNDHLLFVVAIAKLMDIVRNT
ncbi:hypothetical protein OG339_48415 (plasmid) [Streptosporangium sp. NBC_01495]|nr:hypothetical protein [Streptosporangium sp. NBC_01495]